MNEFEQDALVSGAFAEFSQVAAPTVRPLGAQAVRGEVAHRRKVRAIALSIVGALVIALPVAGYAALGRGSQAPPPPGATTSPTPQESGVPGPSASPAPDGRITIAQLTAVKVDVPDWGVKECLSGKVKLGGQTSSEMYKPYVWKIAHTDLDGDAALETAALLMCPIGESGPSVVVAYDRDAAGKIVSKGLILRSATGMSGIWNVTAAPEGGVAIEVSDTVSCCDVSKEMEIHQTRVYAWDGAKYAQTSGPTEFGAKPLVTDLEITVSDPTLGATVNGSRTGTAKVTVRNKGQQASGRISVVVNGLVAQVPKQKWVNDESYHGQLAPGESFTFTITMTFTATVPPDKVTFYLKITGLQSGGTISDLNYTNNRVTVDYNKYDPRYQEGTPVIPSTSPSP